MSPSASAQSASASRKFALGLARALGGSIIFALPLYMTSEMWQLGFTMDRWRLALLTVLTAPLLVGLSHVSGFEPTFRALDDIVDAAVAWTVGLVTAAVALLLLGVLATGQSANEMLGQVTLQAIPGSMGALLAHSQFGDDEKGSPENEQDGNGDDGYGRPNSYWSQLMVMAAGSLFLAFNLAPTEEMIQIAYAITMWHVLALVVTSLAAMHAFVYQVDARGGHENRSSTASLLVRHTLVGYAIAVSISAYILWTFGRLDGTGSTEAIATVLVLALPASIGAGAARLLL